MITTKPPYYWRQTRYWKKQLKFSKYASDYFSELTTHGFLQIGPSVFNFDGVLIHLSEQSQGILINGIYSKSKGGLRRTMDVLINAADKQRLDLFAFVCPFTLTLYNLTDEIMSMGVEPAEEAAFLGGLYVKQKSPDGLSRDEIKAALLRYGFEESLPPLSERNARTIGWYMVRNPI